MFPIANGGEYLKNRTKLLARANGKNTARRRLRHQNIGKTACEFQQFSDHRHTEDLRTLSGELGRQGHGIAGHVNLILEGDLVFAFLWHTAVLHVQLPDNRL